MANLPESSTFDAGVYQLELTDPVIGGPSGVSNAPLKNLANRTKYLKDQVDSLASTKAPLASPAFTGAPTVPTAAAGTNTTQAASTAFVSAAVSAAAPDLTPYAPKASPTFTGNPVAPTPAQFDNDTSLATTEFVKRMGIESSAVYSFNISATLTTAHAGSLCWIGGTSAGVAITMPLLSATPDGVQIHFLNTNSQDVIIQRQGADQIYQIGAFNSITLKQGDTLTLEKSSGLWMVTNGSAALPRSGLFNSSLASAGYQRLPSGLIIQWGSVSGIAYNGSGSVTFPVAFPNAITGISTSQNGSYGTGTVLSVNLSNGTTGVTNSGFGWRASTNATGGTYAFWYLAIGY